MSSVTGFHEIGGAVSFGHRLAGSEAFKSLFKEGMYLVELSAAYLDGPGRLEAKAMPRSIALAYASESMRLTTRLMQMASWLLMQRAVNEGDMTPAQAALEKNKVKLSRQELSSDPRSFALLPEILQDLCEQSLRLQSRIIHLDSLLYQGAPRESSRARPIAIESQLAMLREAFDMRGR
jgi:regulator of CtrA degradation